MTDVVRTTLSTYPMGQVRSSPSGRRLMRTIAELASGGTHTELSYPRPGVRYQHTSAIRAALQERYAPVTSNKMLSTAQRLGLLSNDEYAAAVDFRPVHGERPAAAHRRTLARGELRAPGRLCRGSVGHWRL